MTEDFCKSCGQNVIDPDWHYNHCPKSEHPGLIRRD